MKRRKDDMDEYLPFGDLALGFSEFKPAPSGDLAGKDLRLRFDGDRGALKVLFKDHRSLTWEQEEATGKTESGEDAYEALLVDEGIYFVDCVKRRRPGESITVALDLGSSRATVVVSTLMRLESGRFRVKQDFLHAAINPPSPDFKVAPHEPTKDLLGKRIKYTYSSLHVYEHIYLNEERYTWHCLSGPEKGLADTEHCATYKIVPDIYLFAWWEKIVPCGAVVMVNLKQERSFGKLFGLDDSGGVINFGMASYAKLLNQTTY
jgi:hypothetical protein